MQRNGEGTDENSCGEYAELHSVYGRDVLLQYKMTADMGLRSHRRAASVGGRKSTCY